MREVHANRSEVIMRRFVEGRPVKELNRRTDIVFRPAKVAIVVDGCFWHGCPIHGTQAKANRKFWTDKIEKNRKRDLETTKLLKESGWKVVRFWEHDNPAVACEKIKNILGKRGR